MSTARLVCVPTSGRLWDELQHATPGARLAIMADVMEILLSDGTNNGNTDTFSTIIAIQANNQDEYKTLSWYYSRLCEIVESQIDEILFDIEYETPDMTFPAVRDMGINRRFWYFTLDYVEG